jgi:Trk K+ transport system NAD-binding subunit
LAIFFGMLLGGGLLMSLFHEGHYGYGKACYLVFTMILLQPGENFPNEWYLQILYYAAPILGLFVIADSLVRFGILLFQKKSRLKEWWVMEASTYKNHIIVAGVGRVGYRILSELRRLGEPAVGIERNPDHFLTRELQDAGVPIITGEARLKSTLQEANIEKAATVICATDDDLANLDIALTSRELNPSVHVVLRMFDDTLAQKFASVFKMPAISTSQTAAQVFVAAATRRSVHYSFQVGGASVRVADLQVLKLAGRTIADLENEHQVRVMCHSSGNGTDLRPRPETPLRAQDTVVVLADETRLRRLEELNR